MNRTRTRTRRSSRGVRNPRRVRVAGRELEIELEGKELRQVRGRGARLVEKGLELFRDWSGREAGAVDVREVPDGTPAVLVQLGELVGVAYRSDKWGGRPRKYFHETERPWPLLCSSADGRRLFILGGAVTVRPEGLVG